MITRIVRLTIQPEKIKDFKWQFESNYSSISNFKGCRHLRLFRDAEEDNIFITFSRWDSTEALDAYRNSELFRSTWATVKPMFEAAAVAFSMEEIYPVI